MTTLSDLAARFALSTEQVATLERYVGLLIDWRRGRVTGLRRRDEMLDILVGDALALLDVLAGPAAPGLRRSSPGSRLLDLGSGSGAPGLPLAVAAPTLSVVLLDSVRKKCDFLAAAVDEVGLAERVGVVCARSERFAARAPRAARPSTS